MNLGENIYRLRTEKNMSQGDLADALDVSRQSVSKWENNSAVPELEKLVKMAELFDVTLDELVGKKPAAPRPESQHQTVYPPVDIPPRQSMETRKIVGIVLLSFGLLIFLVFAVLSFIPKLYVDFVYSLVFSAPFTLPGIICLICRKNTALWCGWAIYLPLWLICSVLLNHWGLIAVLLRCGVLLFGILLALFSLRKLYGSLLPLWAKISLTAAIAFTLLVTVSGFLPPSTATLEPGYTSTVIVPSKD